MLLYQQHHHWLVIFRQVCPQTWTSFPFRFRVWHVFVLSPRNERQRFQIQHKGSSSIRQCWGLGIRTINQTGTCHRKWNMAHMYRIPVLILLVLSKKSSHTICSMQLAGDFVWSAFFMFVHARMCGCAAEKGHKNYNVQLCSQKLVLPSTNCTQMHKPQALCIHIKCQTIARKCNSTKHNIFRNCANSTILCFFQNGMHAFEMLKSFFWILSCNWPMLHDEFSTETKTLVNVELSTFSGTVFNSVCALHCWPFFC